MSLCTVQLADVIKLGVLRWDVTLDDLVGPLTPSRSLYKRETEGDVNTEETP